jgi:hypothetical protein
VPPLASIVVDSFVEIAKGLGSYNISLILDMTPLLMAIVDKVLLLGHSVILFPNQVQYSHAGLVGTTEDLSSQMTKSIYHMIDQVIWIIYKVM